MAWKKYQLKIQSDTQRIATDRSRIATKLTSVNESILSSSSNTISKMNTVSARETTNSLLARKHNTVHLSQLAKMRTKARREHPLYFTEHGLMSIKYPYCYASVKTATRFSAGRQSLVVALLVCAFGGWLLCCLIPLCLNQFKDVIHVYPNCKRQVGVYRRIKQA